MAVFRIESGARRWPTPTLAMAGVSFVAWPSQAAPVDGVAAEIWWLAATFAVLAASLVAALIRLTGRARRAERLLATLPEGHWYWASAGDSGSASQGLRSWLGLGAEGPVAFDAVLGRFPNVGLDAAVQALRSAGTRFTIDLSGDGTAIARGAPVADGGAVVWFVDASPVAANLRSARDERDGFRAILDALSFPVWRRGADLSLDWCNKAYADAVEAADGADATARAIELAGAADTGRHLACQAAERQARASGKAPIVVDGQRRTVNLIETPLLGGGTVGAAQDVTEAEAARRDLEQHLLVQKEVMRNLTTPIAVLGTDKRLQFFNEAFASLWRLDAAWLGTEPSYGEILDAMRERRLLPEMADFRAYKRQLLEAFETATEPSEDILHRPDGSTMRITMTPHPLGGVVFTYEDVTSRLALERSLNTQIAVQRATLDNLFEAVAVFGSDGRLKLSNPGFARLWRLDEATLDGDTHIADVLEWTKDLHDYGPDWDTYKANLIGQISERSPVSSRIERTDGTVLEVASVPLPDGATLITYLDVTDSIQKERALTERTEALETADRLKSEFIANISYELRTPLNTIAGFAEILANQYFGALTERQTEYCNGILDATHQLTNTINDILDLASIEAGQMSLRLERFDLRELIEGMTGLLQRRAGLEQLALVCTCAPNVGEMLADQRRVKQILFNLMSNAFKFTPPGGRVALDVSRDGGDAVIAVTDTGIGIHSDERTRVFDRFQRGRSASRRPGTGIGLSLVKSFVELHGGSIALESHPNTGTRIVCRMPFETRAAPKAEVHAA
jgi:signal transduction histidine kinase